ncbi:MAG: hypothetical protein ACXW13_06675 [Burkholderiaceae bacterium]
MEEGFSLQQSVGDPLLVNRARIGLLQLRPLRCDLGAMASSPQCALKIEYDMLEFHGSRCTVPA